MDFESFTGKQKMRRQKTVRKRKLWARRAGALLTAAAITASLCVPNVLAEEPQQTAQEQTTQSTETQTAEVQSTETQPEAETGTETKPEADPVAETKPEAEPGTKAQPEEMQNTETQTDSEKAQQTKESAEVQKEEAEAEPETAEKETEADAAKAAAAADETTETTEEARDGQYDTTKPVIEKVEFPQQGQTLTTKDTLKFYVYAYDAESEIEEVEIRLGMSYSWYYMTVTYDESKGCYVGEYPLSDVYTDKITIEEITVTDTSNNYVKGELKKDGTGEYLYWVNFDKEENLDYTVTDFRFEQQGKTLKNGDSREISFKTDPAAAEDFSEIDVYFSNEETQMGDAVYATYEGNGVWTGNTTAWTYGDGGKWILSQIQGVKTGGVVDLQMDGKENFWYETEGDQDVSEDTQSPEITSIDIDVNGKNLSVGDTVTVTVKVRDNGELNKDYGEAYFRAAADIAEPSRTEFFEYDEEQDAFVTTFEIWDSMYPCEWYLQNLEFRDMAGNSTNIYSSFPEFSSEYPYYFNVVNENTFVNETYDTKIELNVLDEDGEWVVYDNIEVQDVERRATYKEAGINLPTEITEKYPGLTFTGWAMPSGRQIDENTMVMPEVEYTYLYATYDKLPVHAYFNYINTDQELVTLEDIILLEPGATYDDLRAYIEKIPEPEDGYQGIDFQSWTLYGDIEGNIGPSANHSIYAEYDKNAMRLDYSYLSSENEWKHASQFFYYDDGATYQDMINYAEDYRPEDMSEEVEFVKWNIELYDENPEDEIKDNGSGVPSTSVSPEYKDQYVVLVRNIHYGPDGRQLADSEPIVVDKGTKVGEVYDIIDKMDKEHYKGLKFKEWQYENGWNNEDEVTYNGMMFIRRAEYSNSLVRFMIHSDVDEITGFGPYMTEPECDYIYCIVAEAGETVTLPTEFEGYDEIEWSYWPEDGKVTVAANDVYTYYGEGIRNTTDPEEPTDPSDPEKPVDPEEPTDPEKPVDPEEPSNPEEPSKPEKPSNPGTEIPADTVDSVVQEIEGTSAGSTVQVDMKDATVLSKEILEAAKGKDVNIQLNMGSYTWTINGKDIKASDLKDIDMKVTMNTDAIPSSVVKKLAGDNPTMQLSLAHEGDFGFQAKLTLNVGSQYAGKFGNLYYYDSDGKLVYINSGKVAESGNVSLTFSHASDYVVVLADQQYIGNGDGQTGASNTSGNEGTTQKQSGADVVKTGDSAPTVTLLIVMGAAVVVIAGAVIVKKRGSAK